MIRSALEITLGILLLVLAVVGWVLPVISGWMFFIAGVALLSRHFHWAKRLRTAAEELREKWAKRRQQGKGPANPCAVASGAGAGSGIDKNPLDCDRQKV